MLEFLLSKNEAESLPASHDLIYHAQKVFLTPPSHELLLILPRSSARSAPAPPSPPQAENSATANPYILLQSFVYRKCFPLR